MGTRDASNDDLFGINVAGDIHVMQQGREITPGDGDAFLLNVAVARSRSPVRSEPRLPDCAYLAMRSRRSCQASPKTRYG